MNLIVKPYLLLPPFINEGIKNDQGSAKPGLFIFIVGGHSFEDADKDIVCSFWEQVDHLNPKPAINLFPAPGYWISKPQCESRFKVHFGVGV